MAQVGIVKFTPFSYPDNKNDTQIWQHIAGVASIGSAGTAAAGTAGAITAYSITSNVITLTAVNSLTTGGGQEITLSGFGTSTFLNGVNLAVTSATGTSIVAAFTHANASATEAGAFTLTPQYATNGLPLTWIPMATGIVETPNLKPTQGSPTFVSQVASGILYSYDPVHNTLRINQSGSELANNAAIPVDTITFNAEFLKG
jgi:hypothetical protein